MKFYNKHAALSFLTTTPGITLNLKGYYPLYRSIIICLFLGIAWVLPSSAQNFIAPAPVLTPANVTVNRTLPKGALAPGQPLVAHFSAKPTDQEIYRVHIFEEPLVPMEGTLNTDTTDNTNENVDLVTALAAFSQRKSTDDFSAITNFLDKYPQSRWRGALLVNLGMVYRRTGYFTRALDAFEKAWYLLKDQEERKAKVLADRTLCELLYIYTWVGEYNKVEDFMGEIDGRVMEGRASECIIAIRAALWVMQNNPKESFKCGPYALNKILEAEDRMKAYNVKLRQIESPQRGFSLAEVQMMSHDIGLDYQMAYREPGAEIILNSVVHWKLNHYSALIRKENGQYGCEDATMGTVYGEQFWLTPSAFDEEASGYFLVPKGSLPKGWRTVELKEASHVYGKGNAPPPPGPPPPKTPKTPTDECDGMAYSYVDLSVVSLHISDNPIFYSPPKGPSMSFKVDYHQVDSYQPANFSYSNLGPKWTFKWLSYITDDPNNSPANVHVSWLGGGNITCIYNYPAQSYDPEVYTNDVLVRIADGCYELRHSDGSKEVYAMHDGSTVAGRKVFLTKIIDASGNTLTMTYDNNLRIVAITDALGQVTNISYELSDIYKITKVTDPFGRFAAFEYDELGRLKKITDVIGLVSQFKYDVGDFITQMITPYGITKFTTKQGPGYFRSVETSFPLGTKERVEYKDEAPGIPFSEAGVDTPVGMKLFNYYMSSRNTYFWDKKAMAEAPGDYTKARIYHWLHGNVTASELTASSHLESIKAPLENRIWYNYQNQTKTGFANQGMSSNPSIIGRVLDDGTTQLTKATYNIIGAVTSRTDPLGRKDSLIYDANLIDLLEVRQITNGANELLAKYTYNSQHLPLTIKDAAGQITTNTYNAAGQLLTITNAKNETTTLVYTPDGYLKTIKGAISGSVFKFKYDGYGRIDSITDPEGYTIATDYDALNRPTRITFPDGTYQETVYERLDAVHMRDRLGKWSHTTYDSLARPTIIQDALGRITQLIWCNCGSLEQIIDPLHQITMFNYDLQGRNISKVYDDGKVVTYNYESTTSRLKETTDPKGQIAKFQYYLDDNLKRVDYTNAVITTPSVSYTYDPKYNRIATMVDGTGTTTYSYHPVATTPTLGAGQLASFNGPLDNDLIEYSYDQLGRVSSRFINGVASSSVFDALGRITSASNALGTFGYYYVNQTNDLDSIIMANGQTTIFNYFDNIGDRRLKEIWNKKKGGATLSKFDYEYDDEGQITKWTQQTANNTPKFYELGYDLSHQLTSATLKDQTTNGVLKRYAYQYDQAGNRTSEQVDNSINSFAHNNVNQLTSQEEGGPMKFKGMLDEFSLVTISNTSSTVTASVDTNNVFEASVDVVPGIDTITVTAKDYSGNNNTKSSKYNLTVGAGLNQTFSYDDNGNLDSVQNSTSNTQYGWDAADRLVKITQGNEIIEFVYDGSSRRVAEKLNGMITKRWIWCGAEICEERDASGTNVTKRFFPQGEQISGVNYYFTRDHLGSIREMLTSNGTTIKAQYDYDPYGRRSMTSGTDLADFGFTGHYYHKTSALSLALYRAYDANLGRWLSTDPIGENGGLNLYGYVSNDPVNYSDEFGLIPLIPIIAGGAAIAGGATITVGTVMEVVALAGLATGGIGLLVYTFDELLTIWNTDNNGESDTAPQVEPEGDACVKRESKEKKALREMAEKDKRTGITEEDLEAYKELNRGLSDPFLPIDGPHQAVHGPESHPGRKQPSSRDLHGHVGPVGHIKIIK